MTSRRVAVVFLVVVCGVSSVALEDPRDDVPTLASKLGKCKQELVEARGAVASSDELIAFVRAKKIVLVPVFDTLVPVDAKLYAEVLTLQLLSRKISRDQLRNELKKLSQAAANS